MRWWEAWEGRELIEQRGGWHGEQLVSGSLHVCVWGSGGALAGVQTLFRLHKPQRQHPSWPDWVLQREGRASRQLGHPTPIAPVSAPALGNSVSGIPQTLALGGPPKVWLQPPPDYYCPLLPLVSLNTPPPPPPHYCHHLFLNLMWDWGPGKDFKFTARPPIELTAWLFAQFGSLFRVHARRGGGHWEKAGGWGG